MGREQFWQEDLSPISSDTRQGRAFRNFVRKQDENGKLGQEPLRKGGLLTISEADSLPESSRGYKMGYVDSSVPSMKER